MLHLLDLGRPDVFAYRLGGVLTEDDIRTATGAFDAVLARHDVVQVYVEVADLGGIEARALWLDLVYGAKHLGALRHIGRVALVTDHAWIRRIADLEAALIPLGSLWSFPLAERDEARAWVCRAPAPDDVGEITREDLTALDDLADWLGRGGLGEAWEDADWLGVPTKEPRAPRFGHTVHRTHVLLRDIADRLGSDGTAPAYHALRAVSHALRDRLPAAEAADLAAQLPTLVRGIFYEGYRPARAPERRDRQGFLDAVATGLPPSEASSADAARDALAAVGGALGESVSRGEWAQVLAALPADIRALLDVPVSA